MTQAAPAFRALLLSRWGALLAVGFAVGPLLAGVVAAIAVRSAEPLVGMAFTLGGLPTLLVAFVLLAMLALGELPPADRPLPTFLGRLAALAVLSLVAVLPAILASLARPGVFREAAVPALAAFLEVSALLAVAMLFAELGASRATFAYAAFLAVSFIVAPDLPFLGLVTPGGAGIWTNALAAVSPGTAAGALVRALLPGMDFFASEIDRLDHPLLFSPALWMGVLLAWTIVPLGVLITAARGSPAESD